MFCTTSCYSSSLPTALEMAWETEYWGKQGGLGGGVVRFRATPILGREVEIKGVKVTPTAAGDHKPIGVGDGGRKEEGEEGMDAGANAADVCVYP